MIVPDSGTRSRALVPGFVAGTWIEPRSSLQVPGTPGARPGSLVLGSAFHRDRWIGSVGLGDPDMG